MGGGRLGSFRSGDRSEYMALFYLSRVAFANQSPRQEEFGVVDFLCFLGKEESKMVFAENAFYVQVKSSDDEIKFEGRACRWISDHMDLPLVICVADKKQNKIRVYTTWRIWVAFLMIRDRPMELIKLHPGEVRFGPHVWQYDESSKKVDVALGNPVLEIDYDKVEDSYDISYQILKYWLDLDRVNTIGMKVHRAFVHGVAEWQTNTEPQGNLEIYYGYGFHPRIIETSTSRYLTSLCHIYDNAKDYEKVFKIVEALKAIPDHESDSHRRFFTNGEYFEQLKRQGIQPPKD